MPTCRTTGANSMPPASSRPSSSRSPTSRAFRSRPRPTCATTIRSACSRCRASKLVRLHASSGTTGKPTVVGYTHGDLDLWTDLMARSLACAGARPGDIVHNAYGYGLFTGGLGVHYGAERLGCTVVPVSGGMTERQVTLLKDFGAHVLCATPSYALNIAEVAEGMGVDLPQAAAALRHVRRRAVERCHAPRARSAARPQGGRPLRPVGNHRAGRRLRVPRRRRTGCTAGRIISCSRSSIPTRCEPLPIGEPGELVITTLTKEALPMIRYRTRDITRLSDEPCACGRTHVRIMRVTGRDDDMLIIRGVNVYPVAGGGGAGRLPGHRAALSDRADARGRARRHDASRSRWRPTPAGDAARPQGGRGQPTTSSR